ncbi:hypothetical protein ACFWG0_37650 [Streptomyces yangpuensis]|uniref:hypothetical protein n=1 Tax=Streptomyces yangpuensis TaxID=1648182 RepID=UPI00364C4668
MELAAAERSDLSLHPEQPTLLRAMLGRKYGEPPSLLQAAEDLGLHPVLCVPSQRMSPPTLLRAVPPP